MDIKNKKDKLIIGIFIFIVVLVFQFVYFPKLKEVRTLNTSYIEIKRNIDELYNFIGGRENLKDNIINMHTQLALLKEAFPSEKDLSNIIEQLNGKAEHFRVNVLSLEPRDLEIYKDHEGKELKISDYFCKRMPLTLNIESRYKPLGKFLMSLKRDRSPLVSIEEVSIEKLEDTSPKIKAKVDITAYILGK